MAAAKIAQDLIKTGIEAIVGPAVDSATSFEELNVRKVDNPGLVGLYVHASHWDNLVSKD